MPTSTKSRSTMISSFLFAALIITNILLIGWVFIQGHLTTSVADVQSYSVYRELETNGVINTEKLNAFRDGAYTDELHLFTTSDLLDYTNRVRMTTNFVLLTLLLDVVALFAWRRKQRPAG